MGVAITPDGYALSNFPRRLPVRQRDAWRHGPSGRVLRRGIVGIDPTGTSHVKAFPARRFPLRRVWATSDRVGRRRLGSFAMGNPFLLATDMPTHRDLRDRLGRASL